jgi:hypothetical protein
MARKLDKEGPGSPETESDGASGLSIAQSIHEICKKNARASLEDDHQLLLFLQSWWSRTYQRPLKDPILLSYSLEELLYEFYDRVERDKAEKERAGQVNDKIEDDRLKENLDWAEEEERKELELRKKQAEESAKDPAKDPDNQAWMEEVLKEEIEKGKKLYGPDFGEDLEIGEDS